MCVMGGVTDCCMNQVYISGIWLCQASWIWVVSCVICQVYGLCQSMSGVCGLCHA